MDRIKGFDGLRALALIAVFLQHYTTLGRQFSTGGYGVWLFFALSGFLIVRILHGERRRVEARAITWALALRRFFWRRTLRIWPIYYLVLALFTVLGALHLVSDFTWPAAAWHYAYLSNIYFGEVAGRWVGRFGYFWSLAIEEQFYLLAAPILLLSPSRWSRGMCGGVVLAALACDVMLRTSGASDMSLYTNSLTNFGALGFGGWIGLTLPAKARGGRLSWPGLACIGLVIAWLAAFPHMGLYRPATATLLAMTPFWVATLLSVGLLAAVFLNQGSGLVRVLEWAPIAYFGRISYGFYLYHNLLPHWMLRTLARWTGVGWQAPEALEALVAFVVAFAIAALSWTVIERPLLRLKDRAPTLAGLRAGLKSLAPANG